MSTANTPQSNPTDQSNADRKTVHIFRLSLHTKDEALQKIFETVGAVTKCIIIREPSTQRSLRFGFVTYNTTEEAKKAVDELNGKEVDGFRIAVDFARREEARDKTPGRYLGAYFNRNQKPDLSADSFRQRNLTQKFSSNYDDYSERRDRREPKLWGERYEKYDEHREWEERLTRDRVRRDKDDSPRSERFRDRYESDECYSPRERRNSYSPRDFSPK
ncbi:ribonucleoprotein, putative [Entamoeba invadens IP1]|uniref:Ribonucleoprotein, putative n=1 Tax=Entamoeba invadens IP1 TaxID=370355 RepID=A0A0A1TUI0_ENTIV|nr:ribonucleoprotein, putative [Entamoeba invadens IP1]ELP83712.1 ribonucleoprotein, putative [Entamoeba invadens IP1]|eukprot:XP_004183058.1 ribonucleoprotein, putative [Entamoeba invadens IP1]